MATKATPAAPAEESTEEVRTPMAEPEGGWPPDEYTGKGGRYVRDPFTGKRGPAPEDAA